MIRGRQTHSARKSILGVDDSRQFSEDFTSGNSVENDQELIKRYTLLPIWNHIYPGTYLIV